MFIAAERWKHQELETSVSSSSGHQQNEDLTDWWLSLWNEMPDQILPKRGQMYCHAPRLSIPTEKMTLVQQAAEEGGVRSVIHC